MDVPMTVTRRDVVLGAHKKVFLILCHLDASEIKCVANHFHRVLVVVRPVKSLFYFPNSIIAACVSRKRSRVALFDDPRFLFLGDNKSSKRCAIFLLGHVEQGL